MYEKKMNEYPHFSNLKKILLKICVYKRIPNKCIKVTKVNIIFSSYLPVQLNTMVNVTE